jgi:hypothetical protein
MTDIGDIAASPFSPKARENPSANENAPGEKVANETGIAALDGQWP